MSSKNQMDLTIFVPCFNEELNVAGVFDVIEEAIKPFGFSYEVLVIDDASTDNTVAVVEKCIQAKPNMKIRLIKNEKNMGLGANYFKGADLAEGKYYIIVNGDNDVPVDLLRKILQHMGKYDMVVPYLEKDRRRFSRRIISKFFTFLVRVLSGTNLQYYNCTVLHKVENIRNWPTRTTGYGYQAELLCGLIRSGQTYIEQEVPVSLRQSGNTKAFKPANFMAVAASLLRILQGRLQQPERIIVHK